MIKYKVFIIRASFSEFSFIPHSLEKFLNSCEIETTDVNWKLTKMKEKSL